MRDRERFSHPLVNFVLLERGADLERVTHVSVEGEEQAGLQDAVVFEGRLPAGVVEVVPARLEVHRLETLERAADDGAAHQ